MAQMSRFTAIATTAFFVVFFAAISVAQEGEDTQSDIPDRYLNNKKLLVEVAALSFDPVPKLKNYVVNNRESYQDTLIDLFGASSEAREVLAYAEFAYNVLEPSDFIKIANEALERVPAEGASNIVVEVRNRLENRIGLAERTLSGGKTPKRSNTHSGDANENSIRNGDTGDAAGHSPSEENSSGKLSPIAIIALVCAVLVLVIFGSKKLGGGKRSAAD